MARCQRVVFSATLLHIGRLRLLNLRPEWFVPSTLLRVVQPGRQSVLPLRASSLVTSLRLPFWAPPGDLGGITRRHVLCSPTTLTAARAPSLNLLRAVAFHRDTQWYPSPAVCDFRRRVTAMLLSPVEDAT